MKNCTQCGTFFFCGTSECWCNAYPAILPPDPENDCLCSSCLQIKLKTTIDTFVEEVKAGRRENIAPQFQTNSPIEGLDYYLENGNYVFTEWYHLQRGTCCGNGCRHCPYDNRKK